MANDAQLLRQFVEGSQAAFAEVAQRHLALVYSSALRRANGNTALAQEVTQAVFLLLAKKAPHLCHQASVAGWLYGCAQLKATEALRADRRRRVREHAAYLMHEMSTATPSVTWEQIRPVLDHAMLGLNGPDREAVLLRFFEGLPFPDIAARLLLTESAARKRVERALEKLRRNLARNGVTSSAGALAAVLGTHTALAAPAGLAGAVTSAAAVTLGTSPSPWVVSFIALMTPTQKISMAALLVTLLATGGALYQRQAARQLSAEQAHLERQLAAVRVDLRARREVPANPPDPASRTAPAPATAPGASAQSLTAAIEAEQMRLFLADEWSKLAGGALPLLEKLGLPPDQLARCTAMAERELEGSYPPGPGALNRHLAALRERWERETRELIGADRFKRLQQLQAAQGAVQPVASYLAYWDNGFTGPQANRMLELFAANEPLIKTGRGTLPDALLDQARQILSPAQIDLWRRYDRLADTQRQLTERLRARESAVMPKTSGG